MGGGYHPGEGRVEGVEFFQGHAQALDHRRGDLQGFLTEGPTLRGERHGEASFVGGVALATQVTG